MAVLLVNLCTIPYANLVQISKEGSPYFQTQLVETERKNITQKIKSI